ncbi:DUF461 domain-containing protein [Streptomyces sp. IBSBF 2435]|uniref:DUF461 domain-containing protein n=1 Tax=Streptomyces sp. IBSBF 2435 TaxID=2903531 RepID=UPI002FDC3886
MVRSFRRGALAAVAALSLAPLAACAAGNKAQSLEVKPDSQSVTVGDIQVQNAFVLTKSGGPATVSARLFNNGSTDQTLQAVQLSGGLTAQLSAADGGSTITVPAHGTVLLGGQGNPAAVISSGAESLQDGNVQNAVFNFSSTGAVALPVNVTPAAGFFEPYGPSSLPTTAVPTDTATASATPGGTASPGGTATPSDTASPSDTATP